MGRGLGGGLRRNRVEVREELGDIRRESSRKEEGVDIALER